MDAERALQEISKAFRGSAFADRVLMALAKAAAERPLTPGDKGAIHEAAEFLEQVEQGYNWIDDPKISSESLQCAVSFETAIRSLKPGTSSVQFRDDIKDMLSTTRALENDEQRPGDKEIGHARGFFCRILRTEVNDFDEVLSVPAGRIDGWKPARHSLV